MDTVERGDALALQILRHALIRRQHEFFNDTVRNIALRTGDALHQSKFVEFDDRLGKVEVDRAAALAFAVEDHGQVSHGLKQLDE